MIRMRCVLEVIRDALTRENQPTPLDFLAYLLGTLMSFFWIICHDFPVFYLRLNVFTFPATCHAYIFAQITGTGTTEEKFNSWKVRA